MKHRRLAGPRKLDNLTNKIFDPILGKKNLLLKLISEWPLIVGVKIANICYPIKLQFDRSTKQQDNKQYILNILPLNNMVANELAYKVDLIKENINIFFGQPLISKIKIQHNLKKYSNFMLEDFLSQDDEKSAENSPNLIDRGEIEKVKKIIAQNISDDNLQKIILDIVRYL